MIQTAVIDCLAGFLFTLIAVYALTPLAERVRLLDRPGDRRAHERATPAVGGVAMLMALMIPGLGVLAFEPHVPAVIAPQIQRFGVAALVVVLAGVIDDWIRLRWFWRLGAQLLAAVILVNVAHISVEHLGSVLGFPINSLGRWSELVSIVATVGIINAVNWIDGIDGLAGSVCLVVVMMLIGVAVYAGNMFLAQDLEIVAGALCGFLAFNLRTPWRPRAKIFLGNAGADLLGLIIACACFRLTQNDHHIVGPQLAPFLLAPPLIDCLTLILRRLRSGVSPFVGDRHHFHHLLLDAGFSTTWAVTIVAGLTGFIGALAMLAMKAHAPAVGFTIVFVAMWAAYFMFSRRPETSVPALAALRQRLHIAPSA